jgi:hypothetical protein
LRGSARNNFRQHLHLRRSPWPIASPPARTHHPPRRCIVRSPSRTVQSDSTGPRRDRKFKPVTLRQNQTAADILYWRLCFIVVLKRLSKVTASGSSNCSRALTSRYRCCTATRILKPNLSMMRIPSAQHREHRRKSGYPSPECVEIGKTNAMLHPGKWLDRGISLGQARELSLREVQVVFAAGICGLANCANRYCCVGHSRA